MEHLHQGDILKIEKIKHPVLVVSKDFFNTSGEIIGCPIIRNFMQGPMHSLMPLLRQQDISSQILLPFHN